MSSSSSKANPALVAQRVVHLVPVENPDGSIIYMILSLENANEVDKGPQSLVMQEQSGEGKTVLRMDRVDSNEPIMNLDEAEGIFLDKNVQSARQIVSALAAPRAQHAQEKARECVTSTDAGEIGAEGGPTSSFSFSAKDPLGSGIKDAVDIGAGGGPTSSLTKGPLGSGETLVPSSVSSGVATLSTITVPEEMIPNAVGEERTLLISYNTS